ncbi:MAG: aldehyde dehydrogenase family protein [Mycobacterium sp.]
MDIAIPPSTTWVGGSSEPSGSARTETLYDPNTGEVLTQYAFSSPEQIDRALASAWSVHESRSWHSIGVDGRIPYLLELAALLDERQSDIALLDSLNSGVTLTETKLFASSLGDTIRTAVQLADARARPVDLNASQGPVELRRLAWGPTALIAPWNAPSAVAVKKMAYALVAGAPVVLKPSPFSPCSSELVAQAVAEAGFPDGVFSLVLGDGEAGNQICADPRIKAISMTGSTATGQLIAKASAHNLTKLRLELSSNNPAIVLADADVERTVDAVAKGMTKLNGQWCEAPRRVFIEEPLFADFVDELTRRLNDVRLGSSLDEATEVGPMAYRQRRDELVAQRQQLVDQGVTVGTSATVPGVGWFFAPTVASHSFVEMPGEVFGPMITVEPFGQEAEAIASSNAGSHGLAAYVFGEDVDHALSVGGRIEAGEVKINGTSLLDMSPESAQSFFGGSGLGGHGDADVLDFYAGKQIVGQDLVDAPI